MIGETKRHALQSLQGQWKLGAGATALWHVIVYFSACALYILFLVTALYFINTMLEDMVLILIGCMYIFMAAVLSGFLTIGYFHIFLGLSRQRKVEVDMLFEHFGSFRKLRRAFAAALRISLSTLFWSMLFIIPGVIKALSYSFTYFLLIEQPAYTVQEAMEESERMMKGHKRELLKLLLSFWGWGLLVAVTFGLAGFWVMPYAATAFSHFYLRCSIAYNEQGSVVEIAPQQLQQGAY